jgi:hypothetical protein
MERDHATYTFVNGKRMFGFCIPEKKTARIQIP